MSPVKLAAVSCLSALLLVASAMSAEAQAGQTALSVTGSPASFIIATAIAGTEPLAIINSATSYSVTAKKTAGIKKIIGQIDTPMPAGTILMVNLVPPSGASSLGDVQLDATARDLVVNVSRENATISGITYTFIATVAAGVIPSQSRTVTFTLVNYP